MEYNLDHLICYEFDGLSKINGMIEKLTPLSNILNVLENEESDNSSEDSYYYNQYYTGKGVLNDDSDVGDIVMLVTL